MPRSSTQPVPLESGAKSKARQDEPKADIHPLLQTPLTGCIILIFVAGIGGLLTGWLVIELVPWSLEIPLVPIWAYLPLAIIGATPPIAALFGLNAFGCDQLCRGLRIPKRKLTNLTLGETTVKITHYADSELFGITVGCALKS